MDEMGYQEACKTYEVREDELGRLFHTIQQ